jgi:hypothetical protein
MKKKAILVKKRLGRHETSAGILEKSTVDRNRVGIGLL